MALSPQLKQRIESIVGADRVVLFMKGDRQQPRCGFSASLVEMLDELIPAYLAECAARHLSVQL